MTPWLRKALSIRYEEGPWSLTRVDKGIRYGLKSLLHQRHPATRADALHHAAMRAYLATLASDGPPPASSLTLGATGDVMWIPKGWENAISPGAAAILAQSDLRLANLETPCDPESQVPRRTYASFNAPAHFAETWRDDIGSTLFSLCNNHALDRGIVGLRRTRDALRQLEHDVLGGEDEAEACTLVRVGDKRIAVVGTTYGVNPWGHGLAADDLPKGIPRVRFGDPTAAPDWDHVASLFSQARSLDPHLLVVMPHWGFEFEYWPEVLQRQHAYRLLEMGADVIIGSSPHVLQPVELVSINGRDKRCPIQIIRPGEARFGVVAYSLGNFLTSMPTMACRAAGVLQLSFGENVSGEVDPRSIRFSPTVSLHRRTGVSVEPLPRSRRFDAHRRRLAAALGCLGQGAQVWTPTHRCGRSSRS